jgi:4-hydroxythreonine-4-phosphate dehydrogenase (EC 1.1.1.262)
MIKVRAKKINVKGPFPADAFFGTYREGMYDGILAMYHDQGLIPLKMKSFSTGVNFTAGLNIIRTSPDHGTAFDIAGKGIANPSSTIEAIKLALEISRNRKIYKKES